jgi:tRNA A37 threonylcarbamoyladenosine modification protein TsaB
VVESEVWRKNPISGMSIDAIGTKVLVTGPGLKTFPLDSDFIDGVSYLTVPHEVWNPTAAEVAQLGQISLEAGLARDAFTLEPNYIRASAAEEKSNGSQN